MTSKNYGFIAHVRGREGLNYKVGDPITEIIVMRCDETAHLSVEGVANQEF